MDDELIELPPVGGYAVVTTAGEPIPPDAVFVPLLLKTTFSHGLGLIGGVSFRSHEHFLADGRRDPHRCRYWVNGRVVRYGEYRKAQDRARGSK